MLASTLPILIFVLCAAALSGGLIFVGSRFGPSRQSAVKQMPYESGMDPIHDTRRRFDIRFHLVAIAFLIFDVELLFLYPWAVASKNPAGVQASVAEHLIGGRGLVFVGAMVFLVLVVVGFVYDWRKGIFRWR